MNCERCGSSENTKNFVFFERRPNERLCWDCRKPIIYERVGLNESNGGAEADEETESEFSGQVTLGDF